HPFHSKVYLYNNKKYGTRGEI
ncbi:MAG: hypothetical protein JWP39_4030, partial [Jatrophihabitans sp.]|nr:hypothetical protein [Jatrophihabitans sp.]